MRVREATSNQNPGFGLGGGKAQTKMVQPEGFELIQVFDVLSDWEIILTGVEL